MKAIFEFDINRGIVVGVSCRFSGDDSAANKAVLERLQEAAFAAMHLPRAEDLNAHIGTWKEDTDSCANWDENWDDEWIPKKKE